MVGNMLFRDFQDKQRQKQNLNENLTISNPTRLKEIIKDMIRKLIVDNIITSYQRELSSAQMNPNDFIDDFSNKIANELGTQIDLINNRGNWENQGAMIK